MDGSDSQLKTDDRHEWEKSRLRLEIPVSTIRRLMENGLLCAADFRCQDVDSKSVVRRLCMVCCAKNLTRSTKSCLDADEPATGIQRSGLCMPMRTATG